jgi:hypothetical protein
MSDLEIDTWSQQARNLPCLTLSLFGIHEVICHGKQTAFVFRFLDLYLPLAARHKVINQLQYSYMSCLVSVCNYQGEYLPRDKRIVSIWNLAFADTLHVSERNVFILVTVLSHSDLGAVLALLIVSTNTYVGTISDAGS